ncbi:hypothetical protein PR048_023429 [Dryococelus australis]|uniref:Uncharacterized protein n=1 Tax=Dryococelus australis TaxID=614101 RepID=A0ABQ9GU56_9NEOP|nr:hypothetical protein PR048_023429 [Dryococelus australis]
MEMLNGVSCSTSEQHVERHESRHVADMRDAYVFRSCLDNHSPWGSGVAGDGNINCDSSVSVGTEGIKSMVGSSFGNVKLSRKNRANPLASMSRSVIFFDETVPVSPQQFFVRIASVIHHQGGDLMVYLKYELVPIPPFLFDEVSILRFPPLPRQVNKADTIIIDGGYLLHVVVWDYPSTYGEVVNTYLQYVVKNYSTSVIVVFDGYGESLSTKGEERKRSASFMCSRNIELDRSTAVRTSQRDFLKNTHNKEQLIRLLIESFEHAGLVVIQAPADADTLIVETALRNYPVNKQVVVLANDTDIIIVLIARSNENTSISILCPGNSTAPGKLFNIFEIQKYISKTARIFFVLPCSHWLRDIASIFKNTSATVEDITSAGEKFVMYLYTSENFSSLNELRGHLYGRTVTQHTVMASFDLVNLPPTSAACMQHLRRTYLQFQEWLGNSRTPTDWGWREVRQTLIPISSDLSPAPEGLLHLMSCGCICECGSKL